METSSQIGADEHLDRTSDICAEVLKDKLEITRDFEEFDTSVARILEARAENNTDLINLEETIIADQDHNYLSDADKNAKTEIKLKMRMRQCLKEQLYGI